jgi:hypothetical protein
MSSVSATGWRAVPRGVWALGFVSMFMDISFEMIHAILLAFLVSLGASMMLIAGFLWEAFGSSSTFLAGAGFSAVALVGLMALGLKSKAA